MSWVKWLCFLIEEKPECHRTALVIVRIEPVAYQARGALLTPSREAVRTVVGLIGVLGSERESNHNAREQRKTRGLPEKQGADEVDVCHDVR